MDSPIMRLYPFLPPEIKDAIIDEVAFEACSRSDLAPLFRQTLLSFNAASSTTRHRALTYIYKKIEISNEKHAPKRIKALRDLIEPNSSIGSVNQYIKEIVFSFPLPPPAPPRFVTRPRSSTRISPEDLMKNEDLVFILRSARGDVYGVEKFTLNIYPNDISYGPFSIKWTSLSSTFQSALGDLIHSPFLLSLHMRGISQFPIALLENTHLKNLRIQVHENDPGFEGEVDGRSFNFNPSLESLSTNYAALTSNSAGRHLSLFRNLTELEVGTRYNDPRVVLRQVLLQCGQNLSKLTLNVLGPLEFDFDALGIMPNLKAFAITCSPQNSAESKVNKIPNVAVLIDVIQPMEYLEEITLDLRLWDNNAHGPFMDITNSGWQIIDAALSSKMYPNLRKVGVSVTACLIYEFNGDFDETGFVAEATTYLAQQFHQLKSSDVSFTHNVQCVGEAVAGNREDWLDDN